MTKPNDRDSDDGQRARGPFGPLEMLDEVQRQAFEAAMRVAGELTALSGDLASAPWFGDAFSRGSANGGSTSAPDGRRPIDVGRVRADATRAAETFSELMRALLDVGFDAIDELARRPASRPTASSVPGGVARLHCTVHNERGEAAQGVRPHVPQLVSDGGGVLAGVVTVRPDRLDVEPHERVTLEVEVATPSDAAPGRYHGLLLVAGLPELACAVTIDVAHDAGDDDDGR